MTEKVNRGGWLRIRSHRSLLAILEFGALTHPHPATTDPSQEAEKPKDTLSSERQTQNESRRGQAEQANALSRDTYQESAPEEKDMTLEGGQSIT